jgi:subtilisin family serine protease
VAVLDTGVDLSHPLFAARLLPGYDFVDNDDRPDDVPNSLDDDEDGGIDEGVGHGTHISGIIAAIAPNAKILPVRVLNSDGGGALFDILQGIAFAVEHGAQVINFSLSADEDSPLFAAAVQYALAHRVVIIAAAAGEADYLEYPAAYDGVIAVGAIQKDHHITDFSTPYAELVDVFAPGELIYSTYSGGAFAWWSGTSMAAPFVSAEAALLLEKKRMDACVPGCIIEMVINEVESVKPKMKGNGRINIEKAVKKAKKN